MTIRCIPRDCLLTAERLEVDRVMILENSEIVSAAAGDWIVTTPTGCRLHVTGQRFVDMMVVVEAKKAYAQH